MKPVCYKVRPFTFNIDKLLKATDVGRYVMGLEDLIWPEVNHVEFIIRSNIEIQRDYIGNEIR